MKVPLFGVPRHLWSMISGLFSASLGLVLWRLFLLVGIPLAFAALISATGPSGLTAMVVSFLVSTVLAAYYRTDLIRIGANLWNAEWGEVRI